MHRATATLATVLALGGVADPTRAQMQDLPSAAAGAAPMIELPGLEVIGQAVRERGDGPVEGYRATRTGSATRTDTPIRELPQSVSVVPRQALEDLSAVRVDAALDYAGGVTRQNNFGGQTLFEYAVRGFTTGEFYRNGFPVNRGYQSTPDAATIERVEVLRGPAALLYGRGDPGGTFNIVTKQPLPFASYGLSGLFDQRGSLRGTLDATGPVGPFGYRLNGGAENRRSFREFVETDRFFLAPVLTWQATPDTTITLEGDFIRNIQIFDRGVVAVGNRLGVIPRGRFLGEPGDGRIRNENATLQLRMEHKLNNDWTLRLGGQYLGGTLEGYSTEASRLLADNRTLLRERRFRDYAWDDFVVQASLVGRFATGPLQHTLLLGAEYENYRNREVLLRSNPNTAPFAIDIYNPVYGRTPPPLTRRTDTLEQTRTYAAFLQDQVAITPRLKAVAGLRVEQFEQDFIQRTTGVATPQSQTAVTPRVGLIYDLTDTLSAYASYARSFRPNRGGDVLGRAFSPEEGEAWEVGLKLDLLEERLSVTAALFQIDKKNVLTTDPRNAGFSITAGEARSRGFDVALAGNITPGWRVIGGYAYVDAEVTRDNTLAAGTPLLNIPRHSVSLLNVYEFQEGPLAGLGLGGGILHASARSGDNANRDFRLPGYTTVDALAYYQVTRNIRLNLNVINLFDKEYYDRSVSSVWISPGTPRTVLGSVAFRF